MHYRIHIEYQTPARRRLREPLKRLSHWGISGLIWGLSFLFLATETVPLVKDWRQLRRQQATQKHEIARLQQEIGSLRLSGPFSQQWRPNLFVEFSRLCPDSVTVYRRFAWLQQRTRAQIHNVNVTQNPKGPGFLFSLEATGSYETLTGLLKSMELRFQFFRMNHLAIEPQFDEQQYEGQLHATYSGWIW